MFQHKEISLLINKYVLKICDIISMILNTSAKSFNADDAKILNATTE
jgi:hypothetical protein